ncbi:MAG: hypothetical protein F9K37_13705 [Bacteroidales bacterium]|nr:MAG: hypothetical protein F9K37_13705 [Bacteroidales bacterium]
MRTRLLPVFVLVFIFSSVAGQKNSYFKRVFVDAEYYLLYEEYRDALPLYQEIYKTYPTNHNLAYRIGLCYLNIPNEKNKSLSYFEKASQNITNDYKEGYFTETKAPREAFLYYGRALRISGNFEKALQVFNTYKSMLKAEDTNEIRIANEEIESISFAKEMISNPKKHVIEPVGRNIRTRFPEKNPLSDSTGNIIIYTSVQRFYNAILISQRDTGFWGNPLNLNSQLYADGVIQTVGVSSNGSILILSRNDNDASNLYYSTFDKAKNKWNPITKFPKEINTKSWENFGSLSSNGDTLYFSSNREGGFGGFDIYMSTKTSTGEWTYPVNLGKNINTPFDEIAPFVTENSKKLFFSSNGHITMGGFDLLYSNRNNNSWEIPLNLGAPLNTTDDDTFLFPVGNGNQGYLSKATAESGDEDIYFVKIDFSIK